MLLKVLIVLKLIKQSIIKILFISRNIKPFTKLQLTCYLDFDKYKNVDLVIKQDIKLKKKNI